MSRLPLFLFLLTAREGRVSTEPTSCCARSLTPPLRSFCPALRIRVRQLQNRRYSNRQNRRFCGCFRSALTSNIKKDTIHLVLARRGFQLMVFRIGLEHEEMPKFSLWWSVLPTAAANGTRPKSP